jgi:hypothetical protein
MKKRRIVLGVLALSLVPLPARAADSEHDSLAIDITSHIDYKVDASDEAPLHQPTPVPYGLRLEGTYLFRRQVGFGLGFGYDELTDWGALLSWGGHLQFFLTPQLVISARAGILELGWGPKTSSQQPKSQFLGFSAGFDAGIRVIGECGPSPSGSVVYLDVVVPVTLWSLASKADAASIRRIDNHAVAVGLGLRVGFDYALWFVEKPPFHGE